MRILHVITSLRKAAGTSVFCGEVCNRFSAIGHGVTLAVCAPDEQDCYSLDPKVEFASIASVMGLKTREFDLVHIHAIWSPILHKVSKWAHGINVPIVWSPHGMLTPWAMKNKKWKKLLGWMLYQKRDLEKAAMIHVTASSEEEDIRRLGLSNKCLIAPLGVEVGNGARHDERHTGKKTLLFVSRVQRKKGLLNLVKAWASLSSRERAGWLVRIVGPDQEGHTVEVKSECERLGVADDWVFVGPRYGENLRGEYSNADVFVLPTHSENFGSVVIEALSHGVPVITTKGAPWSELEDRHCGWWIDIGVEPLTEALKAAMSLDDVQRREMGARGRALVEEKYTWDAVVKAMVKGSEEVLSGNA